MDDREQLEARSWTQAFRACYGIDKSAKIETKAVPDGMSTVVGGDSAQRVGSPEPKDEEDVNGDEDLEGNPDRMIRELGRCRQWYREVLAQQQGMNN